MSTEAEGVTKQVQNSPGAQPAVSPGTKSMSIIVTKGSLD